MATLLSTHDRTLTRACHEPFLDASGAVALTTLCAPIRPTGTP